MANIYKIVDDYIVAMDSLYAEIQSKKEYINSLLAESEGEVTPEVEEMQAQLANEHGSMEELQKHAAMRIREDIDSWGKWLKNIQTDAAALKEEEQRLARRRKALENKTEWIKSNILYGMSVIGESKVAGQKFTAAVRTSSAIDVDEDAAYAPFRAKVEEFVATLPSWLDLAPKFSKSLAKKEDTLPEGFIEVTNTSLSIR